MRRASPDTPRARVPARTKLERLEERRCPYCLVALRSATNGWLACLCCERRYRPARTGWQMQAITRIIGLCEHGG